MYNHPGAFCLSPLTLSPAVAVGIPIFFYFSSNPEMKYTNSSLMHGLCTWPKSWAYCGWIFQHKITDYDQEQIKESVLNIIMFT